MERNQLIDLLLMAGGVIVALAGALADVIGYGNEDGFGIGQIALIVVGILVAAYGAYRYNRNRTHTA